MIDWRSLPSLSALRAFAAYAETGNVARAGAQLNVSHAAISQQLRALEEFLGCQLLDRRGRQARLTPDGARLAEALTDGFGGIAQAVGDLTGADDRRPVVVSVTPTLASAWLLPRLADFRAAHPGIDLMIDATADVRGFAPGGIDLALRYGGGDWPGLAVTLLMQSPVVVVGAPSLIGSPPRDISQYPWLQEYGTTEATDFLGRMTGGQVPGAGVTSLPGNLMLEAARTGQGLAAVARVFVEPDIAAGRLTELARDSREKGYYIVTRPGVQRRPLKALVQWLRRQSVSAKA